MKLWNKFLVQRRDGTPRWPWLVLGARDPAAPAALRAYAAEARRRGMDAEYADGVEELAETFEEYRRSYVAVQKKSAELRGARGAGRR